MALLRRTVFVALGAAFFALMSVFAGTMIISTYHIEFADLSVRSALTLFELHAGITVFLVLLGAIGFVMAYEHEHRTEALVSLGIVLCSLLLSDGTVIVAAFLAYYGSRAFTLLWKRRWSFVELKPFVLVLLACGVLFGCLFAVREGIAIDESRAALTRFVLAAYPPSSEIVAPQGLSDILRYHGYQVASVPLPGEPTAIELALKDYDIIITEHPLSALHNYRVVYGESDGYTVYEARR